MSFKLIPKGNRQNIKPTVRIAPKYIFLNSAARALLGQFEFVNVYKDVETKRIAVAKADETGRSLNKSGQICVRMNNVSPMIVEPYMEDGKLVFKYEEEN